MLITILFWKRLDSIEKKKIINYVKNNSWYRRCWETYTTIKDNNNSYILSCCASNKIDDLTMWRLYGQNAMGTCLVYDVKEEFIDNDSFFFASVSYGQSEKKHEELDFIWKILRWKKNGWKFKFNRWHIWKHFFKSYMCPSKTMPLWVRYYSRTSRDWLCSKKNQRSSTGCWDRLRG